MTHLFIPLDFIIINLLTGMQIEKEQNLQNKI